MGQAWDFTNDRSKIREMIEREVNDLRNKTIKALTKLIGKKVTISCVVQASETDFVLDVTGVIEELNLPVVTVKDIEMRVPNATISIENIQTILYGVLANTAMFVPNTDTARIPIDEILTIRED